MLFWIRIWILIPLMAAATSEKIMEVQMGFGQVKVTLLEGTDSWTPSRRQQLETDLLIDENLASFVTGKSKITVAITEDELKAAVDEGNDFSALANLVFDKANFIASQKNDRAVVSDDVDPLGNEDDDLPDRFSTTQPGTFGTSNDEGRVVVGSNIEIAENDVIDELVVVAGTAHIHGTVKRLIVVGGNVHLYSTARITEEVQLVGGHIEKDEGAQVIGKQVEVGVPLSSSTWNLLLSGIEATKWGNWISSFWGKFFFSVLKLSVLMILAFLGYWVAPQYQDAVYYFLERNPVASFGWGVMSVFLVLPFTMFLCLSIVGIPLLPLQFSLLCLFALLGYIHVGQYLIKSLKGKLWPNLALKSWPLIFVGLVFLELLDLIPYIGGWFTAIMGICGFGAANKVFYEIIFRRKVKAQSLS